MAPKDCVGIVRLFIFSFCCFAVGGFFAALAAEHHTVLQNNKSFDREEIVIAIGDSVEFKNADQVKHNIQIQELGYNSGIQQPGSGSSLRFDESGRFKVRCGIHSKMKMTVLVE
ncbi:cupredoxin domain-containing protein [Denitrobaculum tricleocarpae]|uniref:EfeO-type cupredoxin-like domain-containing protein n=1 Tax=Denitrobaculum tricleocarpae TaxID=2591009 RepID=A0A545TXZ6_9PROT|nr:hypothetical protein FKG95_07670 [Denitrobaculum tricleocarpae]